MGHVSKYGLLELGPQFIPEAILEMMITGLGKSSEVYLVHNVDKLQQRCYEFSVH